MPTVEKVYNKLVRDKIPEILTVQGEQSVMRVANDAEYRVKLHRKLVEEANEFVHKPNLEELADILEVLRCIADLEGSSFAEIERLRVKKQSERGSFKKKIILEKSIVTK